MKDLEGQFSSYMISTSFEENKESQFYASVNVMTSEEPHDPKNQSPLNQTYTIKTDKGND
jgi:hypothetical protein